MVVRNMLNPKAILGRCKECPTLVRVEDRIPNHPNVYECSSCGYPNSLDDLWEVVDNTGPVEETE